MLKRRRLLFSRAAIAAVTAASVPFAIAQWMASKPWQRKIGAGFSHGTEENAPPPLSIWFKPYEISRDPRDRYDVLVFVESTTATRYISRRANA